MHINRVLAIFIALMMSACAHSPAHVNMLDQGWQYADLRWVDAPGDIPEYADIAAVYLRKSGADWQVRVDFLDASPQNWVDFEIRISHNLSPLQITDDLAPTNENWEAIIHVSGQGQSQVDYQGETGAGWQLRVLRDAQVDAAFIAWDLHAVSLENQGWIFQVCTQLPGEDDYVDCTPGLSFEGASPPSAEAVLAFTEAMPAYTPAQALRRWDGAHTGPRGGRHGLFNLLRMARNQQIPIILADIKAPIALSALDYLGAIPMIERMQTQGLLLAPEYITTQAGSSPVFDPGAGVILAGNFGLRTSQFLYQPAGQSSPGSGGYIFRRHQLILALPEEFNADETNSYGLSLDLRKQLLTIAAQSQTEKPPPVILGGSLPESNWGDPAMARAGFQYIHDHPWIKVLGPAELLTLNDIQAPITALSIGGYANRLGIWKIDAFPLSAMLTPEPMLFEPRWPDYPDFPLLRSAYLPYLAELDAVRAWAASPTPVNTCIEITGLINQVCTIATRRVFSIFNTRTGTVLYLFALGEDGSFHQLIAPSFQFTLGTSDPSEWNLAEGIYADPSAKPGVYVDRFIPASYDSYDNTVRFHANLGDVVYQLTQSGLIVEIISSTPVKLSASVGLDPWLRFIPGWSEIYTLRKNGPDSVWEAVGSAGVVLSSNLPIQIAAYSDSRGLIGTIEDPNQDYPPGHFLPFPMMSASLQGDRGFWLSVELQLNSEQARPDK